MNEQFSTHFVTMLVSLPLMAVFLAFVPAEPTVFYWQLLDVNLSSTLIMNISLMTCFTSIFGVFCYLRWDLDHIEKALFPQILLDQD